MALKAEQLKGELTEQVARRIRDRVGRERSDQTERFARQFYANVPPDDILRASPEQLYGAALAFWQFGQARDPGAAQVRAYHPDLALNGWTSHHSVLEIVNDDMPFLVDSVTAELNRHGLGVHLVIHPVLRVRRNDAGALVELYEPHAAPADAAAESWMHVHLEELTDAEALARLAADIRRVLADVRAAVADWKPMRARVEQALSDIGAPEVPVPEDERAEASAFLRWLDADNFTFLGYRSYRFPEGEAEAEQATSLRVLEESGLGILRDHGFMVFQGLRNFGQLPPDVQQFLRQPRLLMVTKSNVRSTVHRPTPLDAVFVKVFDDRGRVVGDHLFVGLFTSAAYSRSARDIPLLRRKIDRVLARAGFAPEGHDGKALIHILETFPRDELFQIGEDELYDMALGVLHLQERQRTALFMRRDPFERFVTCLVYVPRDRYDTDLRRRIQAILEQAFQGTCTAFYTQLAESVLARVQFTIQTTPGQIPEIDLVALEAHIAEASRAWTDRLQSALTASHGEEHGLRLQRRYAAAFPLAYRERFPAEVAVADIGHAEQAVQSGGLSLALYRPVEAPAEALHLKLYRAGGAIPLSDVLPMLEHMGAKVMAETGPFELRLAGRAESVWLHDFEMRSRDGGPVDLGAVRDAFEDAFARVWSGEMEDDGFNRLVLRAGLSWREVAVLRAYAKYLRQARLQFSQDTVEDTLASHPVIAALLVRLFHALHDPARPQEATPKGEAVNGLLVEIDHRLDAVSNLDEDRILRRFVNLVRATLRTNYYQGKPYIAFKLDSRQIDDLPLPRPWVETFVYSPRVEGVHLRGGKVARGGIRWSDRREDFRTEILGLMKAQMVKNAVIVPVGAKGGFVVKRPPAPEAGRDAFQAEGIECYRTFMRGLLDLADTLAPDGTVVPPKGVVRRDADDPYLVVAADKGTASFSDIANAIALEYGFWLGDAFASGGSRGYSHKDMGITARGAWEAVKRHFRELGTDIQSQDFTVVGVGDMSGDVFGNGMLLSRHIRLLGAFDHRHVFCDPDPDPERSWQERRRLFDLPRSSWADYDRSLISEGGGVFERSAKSVALTPQIRERFGIERERVSPAELIQAMLRAQVDLLWFGGIGTYVKASSESGAEVGDKANDPLRIDAAEIRARVVGEGANLALTQRARIEAALAGVRINTDAIDNSAGVDTSDHEVNIKVLVDGVVARGDMTEKHRDELLAEMTDEVAALVLRDNYLQTQALSVERAAGMERFEAHLRFMRALEKRGHLNRAVEALPDDEELSGRLLSRMPLTRPELAVLLAYAKITLYDDLLESPLPDDPDLERDLASYFPAPLRERFGAAVAGHRLRREIVATVVTNDLVNRVGPTFVMDQMDRTGMGPADVAIAYTAMREAFGLRALWDGIEALDNHAPAELQIEMLLQIQALLDRTTSWLLVNAAGDLRKTGQACAAGTAALAARLADLLPPADRERLEVETGRRQALGVPEALARRVASLPALSAAPEIVRIADRLGRTADGVGGVYFALGNRLGLDWLRAQAAAIRADNHWQRQAVSAIVDDLFALQGQLTTRVLETDLAETGPEAEPGAAIDAWIAARPGPVERVRQLLADLRAAGQLDLAMLAVASRQLRGMVAG
ncbi:NAD-glutamate dehydrogenase [Arenibaculum pallidiluteum]|uniref:NAD-glutamate dehydrogenase n=1 Tax=Arenibaculum pallidiluteum TaxID=2812559 RepID=UPI001A956684|nr:NAD-glutamate dehydrogenase domain-containing protein [Arenibaculum pallidiluteum]